MVMKQNYLIYSLHSIPYNDNQSGILLLISKPNFDILLIIFDLSGFSFNKALLISPDHTSSFSV